MCIVFIYVDNNPSPGGYQIIAAVNRDEFFDRPTKPADFWNGDCIGGIDLEPGREGGTWFGTSTTSKTGALLNILENVTAADKIGRGHLVTEFLTGSEDASSYVGRIAENRHCYNGFNLVLFEKRNSEWSVYYCSSQDDKSPRKMPNGVLVFGNSVYDKPWQKVVNGRKKFEEIVASFNATSKEKELQEELLKLLTDRTSYLPDPQLLLQSPDNMRAADVLSARSAVFVDLSKQYRYGTRTHTLLLIDDVGQCKYLEKTLTSPRLGEPSWNTVVHSYPLKPFD